MKGKLAAHSGRITINVFDVTFQNKCPLTVLLNTNAVLQKSWGLCGSSLSNALIKSSNFEEAWGRANELGMGIKWGGKSVGFEQLSPIKLFYMELQCVLMPTATFYTNPLRKHCSSAMYANLSTVIYKCILNGIPLNGKRRKYTLK